MHRLYDPAIELFQAADALFLRSFFLLRAPFFSGRKLLFLILIVFRSGLLGLLPFFSQPVGGVLRISPSFPDAFLRLFCLFPKFLVYLLKLFSLFVQLLFNLRRIDRLPTVHGRLHHLIFPLQISGPALRRINLEFQVPKLFHIE